MPLTVWQIDPAQLTPYYNIAVCDALAQAGCTVRYFTTRFLYDETLTPPDTFSTEYRYFRGLNHPRLLHYPRWRRILRAGLYPFGHWSVLRQIKRERPDIVHIQWSRLPVVDYWFIRQIQKLGIPVVHTVHDVVPLFAADSSAATLGKIYAAADVLVVHSAANSQSLLAVFPALNPARIRQIPMIAFSSSDIPAGEDKISARNRLGLPTDVPIVLFSGAIRFYKGVDVLLAAFRQAVVKQPDLHLVVAGKMDPLEKAKLPTREEWRNTPNVHLYEGFVPTPDLWQYFTAADVIVHPYRHIYQSAALITAMSYGRAVIVTDVGGMPETIDGNGWIAPPENSAVLAETLVEAASDQGRLEQMGERSHTIIRECHAGPIVAAQLIRVYTELLAARRG